MTDRMKHTPGPWGHLTILGSSESSQGFKIIGSDWFGIATVAPLDEDGREGKANARLIAAAPELLEAIQRLIATGLHEREYHEFMSNPMHYARAAIAKATGAHDAP